MSEPVEAGPLPASAEPHAPPVTADEAKETRGSAVWREIKGLSLVVLAVLGFHSFIAKPFYIPSESMMPVLLKGDRLVVTKYAYGWSFVSPTVPNPAAILRTTVLRGPPEPWGITLPFMKGRLFGRMPERGDVVIVTPPGANEDYIKRVIGLPVDTIDLERSKGDDFGPIKVPAGHLFLMGDNRDRSADSRFPAGDPDHGLGGPVPWENIGGRAEFITFSLDGTTQIFNPVSWFEALRGGRAGDSLRGSKD